MIKDNWEGWVISKTASKLEKTVLEITPPPEVLKTPKAMENVLMGLAGGWRQFNKRDKYWRGEIQDSFSLELVCNNRILKFYVRCDKKNVSWVESKFYAQYPDAQIREVEDYVNDMPNMVPTDGWDMWGGAYCLTKDGENDWVIPIKTYLYWDDINEDRIISPLSQLGETALHLGKDEYVIIQVVISPVLNEVTGVAEEEINKILGKETETNKQGIMGSFFGFLGDFVANIFRSDIKWSGGEDQKKEDEKQFSTYFNLTQGEQDLIKAIQIKESKLKFAVSMNAMYVYKIGSEDKSRISDMNGFLRQFGDEALNGLRPKRGTYPTSNIYFFKKYHNRLRMRRLYFAFKTRWMGYLMDPYYLNVEEIASIYHLPGKIVQSVGVDRVKSKTVEPPRNLIN